MWNCVRFCAERLQFQQTARHKESLKGGDTACMCASAEHHRELVSLSLAPNGVPTPYWVEDVTQRKVTSCHSSSAAHVRMHTRCCTLSLSQAAEPGAHLKAVYGAAHAHLHTCCCFGLNSNCFNKRYVKFTSCLFSDLRTLKTAVWCCSCSCAYRPNVYTSPTCTPAYVLSSI
jgi:hypothetical protein